MLFINVMSYKLASRKPKENALLLHRFSRAHSQEVRWTRGAAFSRGSRTNTSDEGYFYSFIVNDRPSSVAAFAMTSGHATADGDISVRTNWGGMFSLTSPFAVTV